MSESLNEKIASIAKRFDLQLYLTREPAMLGVLSVLVAVLFLGVTALSRGFQAQQQSLGNRWFVRGVSELNAGRFPGAANDFRAALLYSRDDYNYQLNLAEALMGLGRTGEAEAYLLNLWDRQPENGYVNLELARVAAGKGATEQAQRYYHNSIYAAWPDDQQRREVRLELIDFLLKINAQTHAQAELIALEANLGADAGQQARVGNLFLRAQDYEHALAAFRLSLKADPHSPKAAAGAGFAAFQLGRYPLAEKYLQLAVSEDPQDSQSAARLKTAELVRQMDPFQLQVSVTERNRIVVQDFATAGDRLKSCSPSSASQTGLSESWTKMKPEITAANLRRDPDMVEQAMELAFNIEREGGSSCAVPSDRDQALLLIAKMHEGS